MLERTAEAQREHKIAELEIGKAPTQRMPKLWLARIYARRGYVVLSHAMYESMLPPPPKFDTEVALNQADAHLMNKDWTGGAEVLRRYLALDPKNVRGREMLAWALEASGDIIGELAVRQELAAEMPTAGYRRDYGRALERATSFRAARDEYGGAIKVSGTGPDGALITSYQQMRYRSSPELAAGFQVRSDPQAWAWRLQTGASLPVKSRHQFAALAWHDSSTDWREPFKGGVALAVEFATLGELVPEYREPELPGDDSGRSAGRLIREQARPAVAPSTAAARARLQQRGTVTAVEPECASRLRAPSRQPRRRRLSPPVPAQPCV